eukprot:6851528-Pyramimonas_sp.AAC.1
MVPDTSRRLEKALQDLQGLLVSMWFLLLNESKIERLYASGVDYVYSSTPYMIVHRIQGENDDEIKDTDEFKAAQELVAEVEAMFATRS